MIYQACYVHQQNDAWRYFTKQFTLGITFNLYVHSAILQPALPEHGAAAAIDLARPKNVTLHIAGQPQRGREGARTSKVVCVPFHSVGQLFKVACYATRLSQDPGHCMQTAISR